jgi:hypothetical protein
MNIRFAIRQNGIVAFDEDKYVGHITVLNQGVLARTPGELEHVKKLRGYG